MPRYNVTINDKDYDIELIPGSEGLQARINGRLVNLKNHQLSNTRSLLAIDNQFYEVDVRSNGLEGQKIVFMTGIEVQATVEDYNLALLRKTAGMAQAGGQEGTLKAPMPGLVVEVRVKVGEKVKKGTPLLVIEAMKMENIIKARGGATVRAVKVEHGQAVEKGDVLLEFE
jgi:biotin carboxyl carrier protein